MLIIRGVPVRSSIKLMNCINILTDRRGVDLSVKLYDEILLGLCIESCDDQ